MSAYVVSHSHIDALVTFAHLNGVRVSYHATHHNTEDLDAAAELGRILYRANVAAVNYRYNENESADDYKFRPYRNRALLTPENIINALSCYEYQACELPNFETTHAAVICHAILETAAKKLSGNARVSWDMPEEEAPPTPAPKKQDPATLPLDQWPKAPAARSLEEKAAALTADLFAQLASNNPRPKTTPTPPAPVKTPVAPPTRPTAPKTPTKRPPTQDEPF